MFRAARSIALSAVLLATAALSPTAARAAYPGANGLIAFVRPAGLDTSQGDIWTIRPNGSFAHRLTFTGNTSRPMWSPDGTMIAFASSRAGSWDIWVMRGDGTGLRRVTTALSNETDPAWSPDGRWLVFSSDRITTDPDNVRAAIYKLRSTAPYGTATQLTHPGTDDTGGPEYDTAPAWSVDGTIYFPRVFKWPGDYEPPWSSIHRVSSNGGAQVDALPGLSGSSAWDEDVSPDGTQLAWSSDDGSDGFYDPPMEIMLRSAAGTFSFLTPHRLAYTTQNPAWAPDGTRIAYDRLNQTSVGSGVLTIRPDGTGAVLVARNAVEPNWQPRPR